MTTETEPAFQPHLDVLPSAQRRVWGGLAGATAGFVLYGGTAIALQLGHRESVDFDFFSRQAFDVGDIPKRAAMLSGADVVERAPGTLTLGVEGVKVSFFHTPDLRAVQAPRISSDTRVHVASLLDLAATKLDVVQKRAEAKDYLDIDHLIRFGVDLPTALAAASAAFGPAFVPLASLKALTYFGDGNLQSLKEDVRGRLITAVSSVDLGNLPVVKTWDGEE